MWTSIHTFELLVNYSFVTYNRHVYTSMDKYMKPNDFAQHIKRWRDENNKTLRDLAEESGVDRTTIHKIERGHVPNIEDLARLARATGIPNWRALELVGYPSDLSTTEINQALTQLAKSDPKAARLLELLARADARDRQAVLNYLLVRVAELPNPETQQDEQRPE
jgi:transcriptional regulator with XRE-family HTH domain